jgi:hypothetical protein
MLVAKVNLNQNLSFVPKPRNRFQRINSASLCSLAESIPGLLKTLQIRALLCVEREVTLYSVHAT